MLRGTILALDRGQPHEQLQSAFGIGHFSAARDKGVDALARQAKQASQLHLIAVPAQPRPQLAAELVPKRCFPARPKRLATAKPAARPGFNSKRFGSALDHILREIANPPGKLGVGPQAGMQRNPVIK